jgi:rSAM/selenodomain-associated transferase 1
VAQARLLGDITPVLMAKRPDPGRVKTRIAADDRWTAQAAAELAEAMLRCIGARLRAASGGRLILAASPAGCGAELAAYLGLGPVRTLDQGDGDLGSRLDRVWRAVGPDSPVAFFGTDSPDVPDAALAAIPAALAAADVAIGPVADGGYWTLAVRRYEPRLLDGIDWGGPRVYDQSRRRAAERGLVVRALPMWHDVDRPEDVPALLRRVRQPVEGSGRPPELEELAERIGRLSESISPRRTPS